MNCTEIALSIIYFDDKKKYFDELFYFLKLVYYKIIFYIITSLFTCYYKELVEMEKSVSVYEIQTGRVGAC